MRNPGIKDFFLIWRKNTLNVDLGGVGKHIYMWAVMCLPIFHGFCLNRAIQGLYIPPEYFTHFSDCCSTFLENLIRYNVGEGI